MGDRERLDPIGSHRKKSAVSGAQYLTTTVAEIGRGRIGKVRLTVAKDRNGWRTKGSIAAEIIIDATTRPYTWSLSAPAHDTPDANLGPLAGESPATQRVHAALVAADRPVSTRTIGDAVAHDGKTGTGLKPRTIQTALKRLETLGLATHSDGDDGAYLWRAEGAHAGPVDRPSSAHPYAHPPTAQAPSLDLEENTP